MKEVYINRIEKFLPNQPVSNSEIEDYLGLVNGNESKAKGMILRSNKIKTRYYALDKKGKPTHTNTEITVNAIRKLFDDNFRLEDVNLLTAGTSSGEAKVSKDGQLGVSRICLSTVASLDIGSQIR